MNKRKIILDSILNIIASVIPIAILQLIIFPVIADKYGNINYGLMITLVSLFNLFSLPFGNVLNNIRLLQNTEYENKNIQGDFNLLLLASLAINSIIMVFGTIYYEGKISIISIAFIIIMSGLNLIREYLIVAFRLALNYKAILMNNIFLVFGYIIGFLLFLATEYWQFIYIAGYSISLVYIVRNSNLITEKYVKTLLFKKTTSKSIILFVSGFMKSLLTYADRLMLYPLLGPESVAIYYSATIFGKIISMGITPISGVLLSYITKIDKIKKKNFIYIISITGFVGVIGYFIGILISKPFLKLLYPIWADESMRLVYITTFSSVFGLMSSIINPFVLRFNSIIWQLVLNITNFVVYIISTIVFYNFYGLIGFCIGVLIANAFNFLVMLLIFVYKCNGDRETFEI